MKIETLAEQKLRNIQNMVFTLSTFCIAIGIQGLMPLPFEFAWFLFLLGIFAYIGLHGRKKKES